MSSVFSLNFFALLAGNGVQPRLPAATVISPWLLTAGVLVFLCGLICDAYLLSRFVGDFQLKATPKQWSLPELGIVVAVCIGILISCNLLYIGLAAILHRGLDKLTSIIIPVEFITRILILGGFLYYFRARRFNLRQSLSLDTMPVGHALRWGAIFGFASLPPVLLVNLATERILSLFHFPPSEQDIVVLFRTSNSPVLLTTLIIFAVILAPLFEEFLFRGFAYPAIKKRTGPWTAMTIVSVVFALSHFHAPTMPALLLLAFGLALAYELTGSLVTCITMHAIFNAVMVFKLIYDRLYS